MWALAYSYINNSETQQAQVTPSFTQRMLAERIELGFSIRGRYTYTVSIVINRGTTKEAESMPENMLSIHRIYDELRVFSKEKVLSVLRQYLRLNEEGMLVLKRIGELEFVDLWKFASLLLWMVNIQGYRVADVSLAEDLETGEPQFVSVYIDNCGWREWKRLSKFVKKRLVEEGFSDIAGRVALVCRKALQTPRG